MQTIGGLLCLVYMGALGYFGFDGRPWWWVLPAAVVGIALYFMVRPGIVRIAGRDGWPRTLVMVFVTQAVTGAIIFAIGRGIGAL